MTSHLQESIDVCEITIPILLRIPISLEPVVIDGDAICYDQTKEQPLLFSAQKYPDDCYGQMPSHQMGGVGDENGFPMAEVFRPTFNNFKTIPLAQAICLFLTAGHGEYLTAGHFFSG